MKKPWLAVSAVALASALGAGTYFSKSEASDHDDGERDIKARALNLTDHFAFKSPENPLELSLIMYINPRSLPGKPYFLSAKARYEFHVTKVANRLAPAAPKNDFVFRFEAKEPDAAGIQDITLTVLKDGASVGTVSGKSTDFATSQANTAVTVNTGDAGGIGVRFFVGMRADSFYFDVNRFFQVRTFLATRFFGGAGGTGDPNAGLAANCEGDAFLAGNTDLDGDTINLFNPPSCAPDFTKNLNVTAIVLNVPIASLGATVFDTWSTISVKQ
jgi:hypothetical protein